MLLLDHLRPILGSAVDTSATVFVAIGTVGAVAYACSATCSWYPGEGRSSIFVLTTLETIRSSSGRPRIRGSVCPVASDEWHRKGHCR
jgi:hypothetical protein